MATTQSTRLAIVCTHPVQYYAPVFRRLAVEPNLTIRLFYGWRGATTDCFDPGFNATFRWDIDLLEGYEYVFVNNVSKHPGSSQFSGIDLPSLVNEIREWQATTVLVYGWCYKAHLAVLRQLSGRIPVLFRGDSTLLDETRPLKTILRRLALRWVYSHIDVALYVGTNNRNYYLANGVPPRKLVFAPHAIDNNWFASQVSTTSDSIRQRLRIPSDHLAVLFVGKLEPKKGPDLLIEAFRKSKRQNLHLIFAGSGELEKSLREQHLDRVHFMGFQNQMAMPEIYAAADLVILPSRGPGETWGLAINEAMACGKSVAVSDRVGCAIDLIRPGVNGSIFGANNSAEIETVLDEAATLGRDQLRKRGEASFQTIAQWSIDCQVQGILKGIELASRKTDRYDSQARNTVNV
jgi:glycosyltransferase involved in cell wall biosynthesis